MQRILGIDPGSRKIGIGIIDHDSTNRKIVYIGSKVLRLNIEKSLAERLGELAKHLQDLILEYKPDCAILEDIFMSEHARSALILGQARGAVLAILGVNLILTQSLASRQVKLAITGMGNATKLQVAEMTRVLLNLDKKPAEDAADALALAIASTMIHQHHNNRKSLYELAKKQGKIF